MNVVTELLVDKRKLDAIKSLCLDQMQYSSEDAKWFAETILKKFFSGVPPSPCNSRSK